MSLNRSSKRRGAVLVVFAAGLFTFVSFLALVIDVGYLYALKARVQGVCDATALATLMALDPAQPPEAQERFARALTRKLLQSNGLDLRNYQITLESGGTAPAHLRIAGHEDIQAFFAQAIGRRSFSVGVYTHASATTRPDGRLDASLEE